jgi:hypothetical protein
VQELPEDEENGPQRRVLLIWTQEGEKAQHKEVAIVNGICGRREPGLHEIDRVECWWAGEGYNFSLRQDGDALVVERVYLEEMTAETPSDEAARVALPPGTQMRGE